MLSERECVSCAEPWERTADTLLRASDDPRALPLCDWPIPQPVDWLDRVNQALTGAEIGASRKCTEHGRPFGSGPWIEPSAKHLGLETTLRSRGRPRKQ